MLFSTVFLLIAKIAIGQFLHLTEEHCNEILVSPEEFLKQTTIVLEVDYGY